ncbi:MAG: ABC transporter permease [Chloroflexota bacterium]
MSFISWRFIRLWQRNFDVFLRLWHFEVPSYIAEPIIVLLTMGIGLSVYVGRVGNQGYLEFITPGIITSYAMYAATYECTYGTYTRMEYRKTYEAILATPLGAEDIIIGEIFWAATRSAMVATAILAVTAVFGLVSSPWALLLPALAFLEGLLFGGVAMSYTSIVPSMYTFNYYYTLFITPMFYFSGVFFPITSFPKVIQDLSWIAPLTPVVAIARGLVNGSSGLDMLWSLLLIIGLSCLFLLISVVRMRKRILT